MNQPSTLNTDTQRLLEALAFFAVIIATLSPGNSNAAVNHAPQWNGSSSITYNLMDLDHFDPMAYYYCKWGNRLSVNFLSPPFVILDYDNLTLGPYNNSNTDLFVAQSSASLNRVAVPVNANWSQPNQISYSSADNQVTLYRYLHFRNSLLDDLTGTPIDSSTKKLIVLFHGWNPDANADSYNTDEFNALIYYLEYFLAGTDWKLLVYHWEADAATGPFDISLATNPTEAAEISHQHGQHLGELLQSVAPGLEKVQLIAHSAGSWAARSTMRSLLAFNSKVKTELTLLDPYMPTAIKFVNSSLGEPIVSQVDSLPQSARIYLLENYFANELTPGTQEIFNWRIDDINERVDWVDQNSMPYFDNHSGPILWYASTLYASAFGSQPLASLAKFDLTQFGWQRSMFFQEPIITQNPTGTNANTGDPVTLAATATSRFLQKNPQQGSNLHFQWQRNGADIANATNQSLSFDSVRVSDSGDYMVAVSNPAGIETSAVAHVSVVPDPLTIPRLTITRPNGGPASIQFNTMFDETYRLQSTANLVSWSTVLTTNATGSSALFTDPASVSDGQRFYRVLWP